MTLLQELMTMNKVYIFLLYAIAVAVQYCFFQNIEFDENLLSSFISVLSIFFGFYIVSLSIFSMSKFVGGLYLQEIVDKKGFKATLLHVLLDHYKFGLLLNLVSIFYFLSLLLLKQYGGNLSIFSYFCIPLIAHNFIYSYSLLNKLLNTITQELKKSSK